MPSIPESLNLDFAYCAARVLILCIVAGSEAAAARRRRVDYEVNILLALGFSILLMAEFFGMIASVLEITGYAAGQVPQDILWFGSAIVGAVGLLGVAFAFDYQGLEGDPTYLKLKTRGYLVAVALALSTGVLMFLLGGASGGVPTSLSHIGWRSPVLHAPRFLAAVFLFSRPLRRPSSLLSKRERRYLLAGCILLIVGIAFSVVRGPREHLTSLAYAVFVAVHLRSLSRQSESDNIREMEEHNIRMLRFHKITTRLRSTFSPEHLGDILIENLMRELDAESAALFLIDRDKDTLRVSSVRGPFPPPLPLPLEQDSPADEVAAALKEADIPLGQGIVGRVAETGDPEYIYDTSENGDVPNMYPSLPPLRSTVALPLRSRNEVYGVVQLVNQRGGQGFTEDDMRFINLVVEHAGLAVYNVRLHRQMLARQRAEQELRVARDIQLELIPHELASVPGVEFHAIYRAAKTVSGDYYDIYRLDDRHVGIVMADVSGKGVPGALVMIMVRSILKMAAQQSLSTSEVLSGLNDAIHGEIHRGMFVTAAYGVLDLDDMKLRLSCAGHEPLMVIRAGSHSCELIKPPGMALGLVGKERFEKIIREEEIQIGSGDLVLMYTDGVTEAMNPDRECFGTERLCEAVPELARRGPKPLLEGILDAVLKFAGKRPQYDDISMLSFRAD